LVMREFVSNLFVNKKINPIFATRFT
jgi:hypothetical protein